MSKARRKSKKPRLAPNVLAVEGAYAGSAASLMEITHVTGWEKFRQGIAPFAAAYSSILGFLASVLFERLYVFILMALFTVAVYLTWPQIRSGSRAFLFAASFLGCVLLVVASCIYVEKGKERLNQVKAKEQSERDRIEAERERDDARKERDSAERARDTLERIFKLTASAAAPAEKLADEYPLGFLRFGLSGEKDLLKFPPAASGIEMYSDDAQVISVTDDAAVVLFPRLKVTVPRDGLHDLLVQNYTYRFARKSLNVENKVMRLGQVVVVQKVVYNDDSGFVGVIGIRPVNAEEEEVDRQKREFNRGLLEVSP